LKNTGIRFEVKEVMNDNNVENADKRDVNLRNSRAAIELCLCYTRRKNEKKNYAGVRAPFVVVNRDIYGDAEPSRLS